MRVAIAPTHGVGDRASLACSAVLASVSGTSRILAPSLMFLTFAIQMEERADCCAGEKGE